ncbi:MAG: hypothetical protein ACTSXG_02255 [Alphaproteobacteria bacterium]
MFSIFSMPPRLAFLDDSPFFLDALQDALPFSLSTYEHPDHFIEDIQKCNIGTFLKTITKEKEEEFLGEHIISIDLPNLAKTFFEIIDTFPPFTVAFIDYSMPSRNGLEVCQEVQGCTVKKILLTGYLDEREAIKAFHEKWIHGYLRKDSFSLVEDIKNQIKKQHIAFLMELEENLLGRFPFFHSIRSIYKKFSPILKALWAKSDTRCLYDKWGSCIFRSPAGVKLMNLYDEEETRDVILTSPQYESLSTKDQTSLRSFKKVLDYKTPNCLKFPPEGEWRKLIVLPQAVEEIEGIRFALTVKNPF